MIRRVAGPLVWAAACGACAQPSSPPGGDPDRVPPRVVEVFPAPFDTLRDLRAPVVIRFDERLSMRLEGVAELEEAVLVSPATGDVRVERGRRSLEISVAGGWQPGLVYRVEVLPVLRDLFGNRRTETVELIFTTGAPIPPTAVAGFVEDRLTGLPVPSARIQAVRRIDSVVYVAVTDTGGFFSMRHIPAGVYDVESWLDRDRDRVVDFQEAQDAMQLPLAFADTAVVTMALLPMDTTPARLIRAEPVDSLRVRLHFDDYFAPGPQPGRARLFILPDSVPAAEADLIHPVTLDSILAIERARADSLRAVEDSLRRLETDTLTGVPGDTLPAVDTTAVPPPPEDRQRAPTPRAPGAAGRPGPRAGGGAPGEPLPQRQLVAAFPRGMLPDTVYVVEVDGVINIRGVAGGGGTARFRTPRPDTTAAPAARDTVAAPVPPDTIG